VRLSVSAEEGLPYVAGDANQLEQLVLNLLVNAVQACQPGKDVSVTLRGVNQMVRMAVKDGGCGMDPVTAVRAFEPFFTTKAKGTGLGLPICRKIVEAHGGKIDLRSEVGVGTEVMVDIPQVRSATPATSPARVT
jgi:signal transduction histidine kinase